MEKTIRAVKQYVNIIGRSDIVSELHMCSKDSVCMSNAVLFILLCVCMASFDPMCDHLEEHVELQS